MNSNLQSRFSAIRCLSIKLEFQTPSAWEAAHTQRPNLNTKAAGHCISAGKCMPTPSATAGIFLYTNSSTFGKAIIAQSNGLTRQIRCASRLFYSNLVALTTTNSAKIGAIITRNNKPSSLKIGVWTESFRKTMTGFHISATIFGSVSTNYEKIQKQRRIVIEFERVQLVRKKGKG